MLWRNHFHTASGPSAEPVETTHYGWTPCFRHSNASDKSADLTAFVKFRKKPKPARVLVQPGHRADQTSFLTGSTRLPGNIGSKCGAAECYRMQLSHEYHR
jgi:hypothetical protein